MQNKNRQSKKMTLDRLALIMKKEFDKKADKKDLADLRGEVIGIKGEVFGIKNELKNFATKDDLKNFATKDEMLTGFDKVLNKLDKIEQENIVHNYQFSFCHPRLDRGSRPAFPQ